MLKDAINIQIRTKRKRNHPITIENIPGSFKQKRRTWRVKGRGTPTRS